MTDCRDCGFYIGICRIQKRKANLWDYCDEFESKKLKRYSGALTLREVREMMDGGR